jgi:hypothetical protein
MTSNDEDKNTLPDAQYVLTTPDHKNNLHPRTMSGSILMATMHEEKPEFVLEWVNRAGLFEQLLSRVDFRTDSEEAISEKIDALVSYGANNYAVDRLLAEVARMREDELWMHNQQPEFFLAMERDDIRPQNIEDSSNTVGTDIVWSWSGVALNGGVTNPDNRWTRNNGTLPHTSLVYTPNYFDMNIGGVRFRVPANRVDDEQSAALGLTSPFGRNKPPIIYDLRADGGNRWIKVGHDLTSGKTNMFLVDVTSWANLYLPGFQGASEEGIPPRPTQVFMEIDSIPGSGNPMLVQTPQSLKPAYASSRA